MLRQKFGFKNSKLMELMDSAKKETKVTLIDAGF